MILFGITIYVIISFIILFHKIFSKKPFKILHNYNYIDINFKSIIQTRNTTNSSLVLMILHLIFLQISALLHILGWLLINSKTNLYLFLLSAFFIIPYMIIDSYFTVSIIDHSLYTRTIFALFIKHCLLILWMICLSLRYDFNSNIDDKSLIIPLGLRLIMLEYKSSSIPAWIFNRNASAPIQWIFDDEKCSWFRLYSFIEGILFIVATIIVLSPLDIIRAFYTFWFIWFCQCIHGFIKLFVVDKYTKNANKYLITRDTVNDNLLLDNINQELQNKRDEFDKNGVDRLRNHHLICDLISPNHVAWINHKTYDEQVTNLKYFNDDDREDDTLKRVHQQITDKMRYRWIPTEFMLKLKDDYIHNQNSSNLNYDEFLNIELVSGFIPDIN